MCRLFALTSTTPVSPMKTIEALDLMKEGHDGSGVGLYLNGLSGPFADLKDCPILSGIFSESGLRKLDKYMGDRGFNPRYTLTMKGRGKRPGGVPRRDAYLVRAYATPDQWADLTEDERGLEMLKVRLELREQGAKDGDMTVYSFWPDSIMIKEIGDPLAVGAYLGLDRDELKARRVLAQGRQNTNYAINLYACHPFFIQGVATMTNGENTAFVPIREFLSTQGVPGYIGYNSDSEVFTHIMHFTLNRLKLGVEHYKHIITPLADAELAKHPQGKFLGYLKNICRRLIIDGPNCVIGRLPDDSMFMVQDRKKLRPGVVGGKPGLYAFSSEICGLDAVAPDRDKSQDFQPMHLDTVVVAPDCKEVNVWRQTQPLPNLQ